MPVRVVDAILFGHGKTHENEVSNEIRLTEFHTSGVQGFEDGLCVVSAPEPHIHDFKTANPTVDGNRVRGCDQPP